MRKYYGAYPNIIVSLAPFIDDWLLAHTNNGGKYLVKKKDKPVEGTDVFQYKFQRPHTWDFQQDVNAFHRIVEGYALPFVTYINNFDCHIFHGHIEDLQRWARNAFVEDMAKQGIIARIKE